jgi:hypothetical protein
VKRIRLQNSWLCRHNNTASNEAQDQEISTFNAVALASEINYRQGFSLPLLPLLPLILRHHQRRSNTSLQWLLLFAIGLKDALECPFALLENKASVEIGGNRDLMFDLFLYEFLDTAKVAPT